MCVPMREQACGRAGERACGRAGVRACGRAGVRACGRSDVRARGRSDVRTCGRADVRTCGRADVRMCGRADVRTCGRADVRAGERWYRRVVDEIVMSRRIRTDEHAESRMAELAKLRRKYRLMQYDYRAYRDESNMVLIKLK